MVDLARLMNFIDQVVVVTGASRGIGRAIALVFAQAGARLALVSRTADALEAVAAEVRAVGAEALVLPTDVAVEAEVDQAIDRVVAEWGRVDVLVNNAGLIDFGPLHEIEPTAWDKVMGANLTGAYLCSRAVAPVMEKKQAGRIVNITSAMVKAPRAVMGLSTAARSGLTAMCKGLSVDLAPFNITINNMLPERFDTDRQKKMAELAMAFKKITMEEARAEIEASIAAKRMGDPSEFGDACAFLCSAQAGFITGQNLQLDGGTYPGLI